MSIKRIDIRTGYYPGGFIEVEKPEGKYVRYEDIKDLIHYQDTVTGLWCTDKPDIIPKDKKHLFFRLGDSKQ